MIHTLIHHARWRATLCALFALLTLTACDVTNNDRPDPNIAASSLAAYNFSAEGIQEFYVDGAWGSNVGIGSGGSSVCCVMIPSKWHGGLQVTVEWRRSDCGVPKSSECTLENVGNWPKKTLKKTVPIEPYDEPDETQVFFLPHDEIRVYVTKYTARSAHHPAHLGRARPLTEDEFTRFISK
ncbi:MAG TPA: DUF3304 domain-containing protein [Denitromonas sp.]|uniref:DUF3304 domain-containing protein n=1 Tax=Denitromonas sp. TaxID=2734609 RepID=UPI001DD3A8D6|nr:DUF3304 domain-containing protein [Rhodocyclaceae bacterium]MCP5222350.1 DUF3304 domain-containing protein [Zoogloeaceae bacterium]HPR06957.1 DUF3304 domain-containing protein [Denitromonas sp.]HQU89054.1 DUF3304 domain-containing protein [Denitromonas sp.]HQV15099.1 DUF3304 domain-containing protein [Denitromonas sp.]